MNVLYVNPPVVYHDDVLPSYIEAKRLQARLAHRRLAALQDDYARMFDDGLLPDDAEPFQALMSPCEQIANRANR